MSVSFARSRCSPFVAVMLLNFSLLLGYLKHVRGAAVTPQYAETCTDHCSSSRDHILVKETDDLASHVLPSRLLMVHDTSGCGQNNVAELTRWQQFDDPLLEIA